jgi:hypothetical protein
VARGTAAFDPGAAAARPDLVLDRVVVVGRVDDGTSTDAATEARAYQRPELAPVMFGHRGKCGVVIGVLPAAVRRA